MLNRPPFTKSTNSTDSTNSIIVINIILDNTNNTNSTNSTNSIRKKNTFQLLPKVTRKQSSLQIGILHLSGLGPRETRLLLLADLVIALIGSSSATLGQFLLLPLGIQLRPHHGLHQTQIIIAHKALQYSALKIGNVKILFQSRYISRKNISHLVIVPGQFLLEG